MNEQKIWSHYSRHSDQPRREIGITKKFTHIHCQDSVLSSRCRTYYSRNLDSR